MLPFCGREAGAVVHAQLQVVHCPHTLNWPRAQAQKVNACKDTRPNSSCVALATTAAFVPKFTSKMRPSVLDSWGLTGCGLARRL
jgi:hypothetical protein